MQKPLILSFKTDCVLYESAQDGQSMQGLSHDVSMGTRPQGIQGSRSAPLIVYLRRTGAWVRWHLSQ